MEDFKITRLNDVNVELHTRAEQVINSRLLRGRALFNNEDTRLTFVQNEPRPYRSKEAGRSEHARCVLRPDGAYTLTLRFRKEEKYILPTLISEVRAIINGLNNNLKLQKNVKRKRN